MMMRTTSTRMKADSTEQVRERVALEALLPLAALPFPLRAEQRPALLARRPEGDFRT